MRMAGAIYCGVLTLLLVACSSVHAAIYTQGSCAHVCTPEEFIPKLPIAEGAAEAGENRPYAWAIEALIQTKLNFEHVSPPASGRICGIVGACLYEASTLVSKDLHSFSKKTKKISHKVVNSETLNDAIDGAGFWALYRLFGDLPSFENTYGHYETFSGKTIRDMVPVIKKATQHMKATTYGEVRQVALTAGAVACERIIQMYVKDGFTPRGDLRNFNPSVYEPSNPPQILGGLTHCDNLEKPNQWQPLCVPRNEKAYGTRDCMPQDFVADWAGRYTTFALEKGDETDGAKLAPPPPKHRSKEFDRQADEVLKISGKLGDREKVLAEYWADGPDSTLPPGHLWKIAADAALYEGLSQFETSKLLFIVGTALNDAGVGCWRVKTTYDFTRPLQMIQCGATRNKVREAWLGPYLGSGLKNSSEWRPYQASTFVSPGFAGYTSGHSTFTAAAAEALKLYFGNDRYRGPRCDIVKEGESLYEPKTGTIPGLTDVPNKGPGTKGYTPAQDVILCWRSWTDAAIESGQSRLYGGIHVKADDTVGQALGRRIARQVYRKIHHLS